jgi:hypothetical protein
MDIGQDIQRTPVKYFHACGLLDLMQAVVELQEEIIQLRWIRKVITGFFELVVGFRV